MLTFCFKTTPFPVPPKREALLCAPSPLGEGWEGGIIPYQKIVLCIIQDTQ